MSSIPPRPRLDNPTESTFTADWDPVEGAKSYKVYVREFPKPWEQAECMDVSSGNKAEHTVIEGRFPTSTYQVRYQAVFADGTLGPFSEEATVDTAVSDCVPGGEKKKNCVIA